MSMKTMERRTQWDNGIANKSRISCDCVRFSYIISSTPQPHITLNQFKNSKYAAAFFSSVNRFIIPMGSTVKIAHIIITITVISIKCNLSFGSPQTRVQLTTVILTIILIKSLTKCMFSSNWKTSFDLIDRQYVNWTLNTMDDVNSEQFSC